MLGPFGGGGPDVGARVQVVWCDGEVGCGGEAVEVLFVV